VETEGDEMKKKTDISRECARCGKTEVVSKKREDWTMVYVGRGNDFCVECFARTDPWISEKIWEALMRLRKAKRRCKHCKRMYRSDYWLKSICDKCAKQGWEYIQNLEGKMEVRNWKAFMKMQNKKEKEGRLFE
jgi:hypothetical protein